MVVLVTTNNPVMVVDVAKLGYLGSGDHMMIETSIAGPAREEDSTEMVPDWHKADLEGMKQKSIGQWSLGTGMERNAWR